MKVSDTEKTARDEQIVREVMDWHDSIAPKTESLASFFARLGAKFEVSERTIYYVLENNAVAILEHKEHERLKRVFRLKREIAKQDDSKKDVADLLDQLRSEYEGKGSLVDQSTHVTHITVNKINLDERARLLQGDNALH